MSKSIDSVVKHMKGNKTAASSVTGENCVWFENERKEKEFGNWLKKSIGCLCNECPISGSGEWHSNFTNSTLKNAHRITFNQIKTFGNLHAIKMSSIVRCLPDAKLTKKLKVIQSKAFFAKTFRNISIKWMITGDARNVKQRVYDRWTGAPQPLISRREICF